MIVSTEAYTQPDEWGTVTLGEWGGYIIQIMPMLYNHRLVMTPKSCTGVYDHGWCYEGAGFEGYMRAFAAAAAWDPETEAEPPNYVKRATGGLRLPGERALD